MVMKKLTIKQVIEKFQEVHEDKYDYSEMDWQNRQTPVRIVCRQHGPFYQKYDTHRHGRGCRGCFTEKHSISPEEFLNRIKGSPNEKYLTSTTHYVNMQTLVTLHCEIHGSVEASPKALLSNRMRTLACPKCRPGVRPRKLDQKSVLDRFKKAHGDRYDYSLVRFTTSRNSVTVICKTHGSFEIYPQSHWQGSGCKFCGNQINLEKCIARFREIHGYRYDYSKVDYQGPEIPVVIICPEHGEFNANPANHWKKKNHANGRNGESCPNCNSGSRLRSTTEMIEEFRAVHGEKYDYSKFEHENMHKPEIMICPQHGEFPMSPANHLQGHQCKFCARKDESNAQRQWFEAFLLAHPYPQIGHEQDLLGGRWGSVDLLLQIGTRKVVVEYDGQYWHSREKSFDKDARKTAALISKGYEVIRLRTVETQRHPQLVDIPQATNIRVNSAPKLKDLNKFETFLKTGVLFSNFDE